MKQGRISTSGRFGSAIVRRAPAMAVAAVIIAIALHADAAYAQGGDPFATARVKAEEIQAGLKQLAAAVGMVGITICLMLGYFNKLSWKWLATGIGVSFALNVVPAFVGQLARMAGG